MARNWSEAVKVCEAHPRKGMQSVGRWCRCKGKRWRYRMGEPDPVTGRTGPAKWSPRFPSQEAADADQAARRAASGATAGRVVVRLDAGPAGTSPGVSGTPVRRKGAVYL